MTGLPEVGVGLGSPATVSFHTSLQDPHTTIQRRKVIGLNYKGAKASEPGSYGLYANYYDQARGTVIAHTMNGFYGNTGFKGYMIGANYTLAKNIVATLEWYDLKEKSLWYDYAGYKKSPEVDMETLWAQVVFTF